MKHQARVERKSEREYVVSRTISCPTDLVFEAWSRSELFKEWWVPKSAPMTLVSCEMDVRTGGTYRLRFEMNSQTMDFFGKYLEVVPLKRMVWTNDEGGPDAAVITTVTFAESNGETLLTVHDLYPSTEALDESIESGATSGMPVQLDQLEEFVESRKASR